MTLSLRGVLPVSSINLGLALTPPVLQAEITQLGIDLSNLTLAIAGQLEMGLNVPSLAGLLATLNDILASLAGMLDPTKWVTLGADLNADLVVQLGIIDAALALMLSVSGTLTAGLSASGLAAWSYSGPANSVDANNIGSSWLPSHTGTVEGIVIATESPSSWGQFSVSVNTGPSNTAPTGGPPTTTFLGELSAGELCPGVLSFKQQLDLLLFKFKGLKAQLELSIQLTLGLNLPDVSGLLDKLQELIDEASHLLDNLINVKVDLSIDIGKIQLRLDYILALSLSIGAQLSAGGLALWSYSGTISDMGEEIARELASGIPGGSGPTADIRMLTIACAVPSVWANFGLILGG